jgi:tetratricopeptide (TPR) repeat protein
LNALARHRQTYRQVSGALLALLLVTSCRLLSTGVPVAASAPAAAPPAETVYSRAEEMYAAGRYEKASEILAAAEGQASSPLPPVYFLLQGKIAAAQNRFGRARYYLRNLSGHPESGPAVAEGMIMLADLCYQDRLMGSAFDYYLEAVNRFFPQLSPGEASRLHLRLSRIALYQRRERRLAGTFLLASSPELLAGEDAGTYQRIRKQLTWQILSADRLGVRDGNISALEIDGDDLWIGTWNGGVIRYSLAGDTLDIFRRGEVSLDANTVRSIKAYAGRIWVGSYRGLYSYSRAASAWSEEGLFGGADPIRVEVLEEAGGQLYAGTLGRGLWRLENQRWQQVDGLEDAYVNALCAYGGQLAIGTMKRGLLFYDPEDGSVRSFDEVNPGLEARNITLLLADPAPALWIGTYGLGLYHWQQQSNDLRHFSRRQGDIPDDWVLAGAPGPAGSYFGTFGGGVVAFSSPDSRPRIIGLREGLPSLDISVVRSSPPFIYFGTLGAGVVIYYVHPES